MKKLLIALMALSVILPATSIADSYPGFGGGLLAAGGGAIWLVGGNYGLRVHPMVGINIEGFYNYSGGSHVYGVGGGADIFFLGFLKKKLIIDPYAYGHGGYMGIIGDGYASGGFIRFGGGVPFVLNAPVTPYVELGAFIGIGSGGTLTAFNLMGGIRF